MMIMKHLCLIVFVLGLCGSGLFAQEPPAAVSPTGPALVYVVPIKGAIMDSGIAYFVRHAVEKAKADNASLIIFEIDTPGGAVGGGEEYTIGICNSIDRAAPITTVAYITHWAWSAGALVSISADKIVMRQVASIGSAEVVGAEAHQEKYTSAIRTEFKARAEKKGYPVNLMMAMVDKDLEVKEVLVNGQRHFLTPDEIKEERNKGNQVEEVKLIIANGKLLNLSAGEALKYGLAMAIKDDRSEIPPLMGISDFTFKEVTPTWSESLVMYITSPVVRAILILAGLIAAGMAFKAPGTGLLEAIAVICFGLVFFGGYLVGLAEITEILIFILGVGLLVVEVFLLPGFGVFGIAGIITIFISLILSMQSFTIPDIETAPWQWHILKSNFIVVGLAGGGAGLILIALVRHLSSVPFFSHLILSADVKDSAGFGGAVFDASPFMGKKAVVFTALRPVGKITLLDDHGRSVGENIDAVTEGDFIEKGETVAIISVDGGRIVAERSKA